MPVYDQCVLLTGDTMTGDLTVPNLFVALGGQIVIGGDAALYRDSADALRTDDALFLYRNAAGYTLQLNNPNAAGHGINFTLGTSTSSLIKGQVTGDAGYRVIIDATGTYWWGPGTGAYDVYLYRSAVGTIRTDGKMFAQSGFITPLATKTSDYTLTSTDAVVLCNGTMTATLPSATTAGSGRQYTVKNIHASATVTLAATAGTIDSSATASIAAKGVARAVSDGTNWWLV